MQWSRFAEPPVSHFLLDFKYVCLLIDSCINFNIVFFQNYQNHTWALNQSQIMHEQVLGKLFLFLHHVWCWDWTWSLVCAKNMVFHQLHLQPEAYLNGAPSHSLTSVSTELSWAVAVAGRHSCPVWGTRVHAPTLPFGSLVTMTSYLGSEMSHPSVAHGWLQGLSGGIRKVISSVWEVIIPGHGDPRGPGLNDHLAPATQPPLTNPCGFPKAPTFTKGS